MNRWRGREDKRECQVANACDSFVDLTPASATPAQQVLNNWSALTRGQAIPLIGETRHADEQDDCC